MGNSTYFKTHPFSRCFILLLLILLMSAVCLKAEETVVVGQVLNREDKTPIASVNVQFKNSGKPTQSNEEGYFMIRNRGYQTSLVFTAVGFKPHEVKIKRGKSVGIQVELEGESIMLHEVMVMQNNNSALELMKKVRQQKKKNDYSKITKLTTLSSEQILILLSKINQRKVNKKIYEQLQQGALKSADSSLTIPLYMAQNRYQQVGMDKKLMDKNTFCSPRISENSISKLLAELNSPIDFYENTITLFGKSFISPLSNMGSLYYNFYLTDSLNTTTGKQYEIRFITKNGKNLAFNGHLKIDSAQLAITSIDAELPPKANVNYIHNLHITQDFTAFPNQSWRRVKETMGINMNFELLADSLHPKPEIMLNRSAQFNYTDTVFVQPKRFAQGNYAQDTLVLKMGELNKTAAMRTAKIMADLIIAGYIPVGKIDIGQFSQFTSINDQEGIRLTLPIRTNEELWKNICLGGSVGYALKNGAFKYSGLAQYRLPGEKKRMFGFTYTNDYRRVDYNFNALVAREYPLIAGGEKFSSMVLAFKLPSKLSLLNEYTFSFFNDWNKDIESTFYLRTNELFVNPTLIMAKNSEHFSSLKQSSVTITTRFSFDEKTSEDHLQRTYIRNFKPFLFATVELGKYQLGSLTGDYGKVIATVKQSKKLDIGLLNYTAEAGALWGAVPYPLLQIPPGSETYGYGLYHYNMMNYMEFAADQYFNLHSELIMNGLILNQIPLIKNLNLREMFSYNFAYGSLREAHANLLDYPTQLKALTNPYSEVGVGVTNILRLFSVQSMWRISNLNKAGVVPWGIRGSLNVRF
jgi:hypothetical protein